VPSSALSAAQRDLDDECCTDCASVQHPS
jgi:hypothetical protein